MLERSSLSEQIAATIIADILDQHLVPGSLLLSEPSMASQFGVSRPVIREAIRILATQGVVRTKHGRGVIVQEPNNRSLVELITLCAWRRQVPARELWQARLILEVPLAGIAAEMRDEADLTRMRSALDRMRERFEEGSADNVDANVEFHRAMATAAHNEFIGMLMEPVTQVFHAVVHAFISRGLGRLNDRAPDGSQTWPEWSLSAHQQIYEAIDAGNATAAKERMKLHFGGSMLRWEALLALTLDELLVSRPPHLKLLRAKGNSDTPTGRSSRKEWIPL